MSAVLYEKKGNVAKIRLNRPEAKNVIDQELVQELEGACREINRDDEVHVVVICAAGEGAFCAGSQDAGLDAAAAVASIEKPVIAAIDGDARDAGLELALACDIRLASDRAVFGMGQVAAGRIPVNGGTQRLPRLIGKGKALEMVLTGEDLDAREAFKVGLISRVVSDGRVEAEAESLALNMAGQAPISLRFVKEAVNKGMDMTLDQGLRLEGDLYFLLHTTADRTEGIKAFLEKRKAEFKGK